MQCTGAGPIASMGGGLISGVDFESRNYLCCLYFVLTPVGWRLEWMKSYEEYGFGRKTILDTAAKSKADIDLDACLKQRRMEGSKTKY